MTDDELIIEAMARAISDVMGHCNLATPHMDAARAALHVAKNELIERAARIIEDTKAAPENCDVLEHIHAQIRSLSDD